MCNPKQTSQNRKLKWGPKATIHPIEFVHSGMWRDVIVDETKVLQIPFSILELEPADKSHEHGDASHRRSFPYPSEHIFWADVFGDCL